MHTSSIAMLDKDHHIHIIPSGRIVMMSIEHSAVKKIENERFEIECSLRLHVEGCAHPLDDMLRFTFAAAKSPGNQMMAELTFVQNHIIKQVFDQYLSGEIAVGNPEDPQSKERGITISSEIKTRMLASQQLIDVLGRYTALPDSIAFIK